MDKDPFQRSSVVKTDPCLYLVKYSPDVFKKKTKVLDIRFYPLKLDL